MILSLGMLLFVAAFFVMLVLFLRAKKENLKNQSELMRLQGELENAAKMSSAKEEYHIRRLNDKDDACRQLISSKEAACAAAIAEKEKAYAAIAAEKDAALARKDADCRRIIEEKNAEISKFLQEKEKSFAAAVETLKEQFANIAIFKVQHRELGCHPGAAT